MKYFEVKAKCGHVGRKYYALKTFAVKALNGKEAAKIARNIPRVKHHHKDAIKEVSEINETRFQEIIETNKKDPYFHCVNIQEQKSYIDSDIFMETKYTENTVKENEIKKYFIGKKMIRKPKQYIKNYRYEERWAY